MRQPSRTAVLEPCHIRAGRLKGGASVGIAEKAEMSSLRSTGWNTARGLDTPFRVSTLVRTIRFARFEPEGQAERIMEFAQLAAMPLTTIDGAPVSGLDMGTRPTLLILIDAYRINPERIAAEIGWVRERLDPAVDLVLVWPRRATGLARTLRADTAFRMYVDGNGDFRRLVSPGGRRIALLVDPTSGTIARVTGANAIFAALRMDGGPSDRGSDHMIDLGDVYH